MHIDAEVHFWKIDKGSSNLFVKNNKLLNQHYLPEQITQTLHRNAIDGCIAVVTDNAEVETRFLSELALTHPEIKGVIGWLDLYDPKAGEKIQAFQEYSPLRGYRIETDGKKTPGDTVMQLLQDSGYSVDLTLRHDTDIFALSKWISAYPEQQFILQNSGYPERMQSPSPDWEKQIRELAKNQNLSCKVSGLLTGSNPKSWKPADFYPFLNILFDSFSIERLLFASDWPFLLLAGMYVQWKSLLEKFTENFIPEERDKFFGENAQRIYRL